LKNRDSERIEISCACSEKIHPDLMDPSSISHPNTVYSIVLYLYGIGMVGVVENLKLLW
jgi:hypothetical protein